MATGQLSSTTPTSTLTSSVTSTSSTSAPNNLITLADLQDRLERGIAIRDWTISARVVSKDQIRHWSNKNGSGRKLSFHITDSSRFLVNCICFGENVDHFDDLLDNERVYYISNASFSLNPYSRRVQLTFRKNSTSVIRCPRDVSKSVPYLEYGNFTPLNRFHTVDLNQWVDVVGVVIYVSEEEDASSSGRLKRDFYMSDESNHSAIKCVLWASHLDERQNDVEENYMTRLETTSRRALLHKVVVVKQGLVRAFNNEKYVSIVANSMFQIEPRSCERVGKLKDWFSRNKSRFRNFVPPRQQERSYGVLSFRQAREKLKSNELTAMNRKMFFVNETCTVIDVTRMEAFAACRECKSKLDLTRGNFCTKCDKIETSPEERYFSWLNVFDNTTNERVVCYDNRIFENIFGVTMENLCRSGKNNPDALRKEIENASKKMFKMKLRAYSDEPSGEPMKLTLLNAQQVNDTAPTSSMMRIQEIVKNLTNSIEKMIT